MSAFSAVVRLPPTAASIVSISYAFACDTRPSISGASGAVADG